MRIKGLIFLVLLSVMLVSCKGEEVARDSINNGDEIKSEAQTDAGDNKEEFTVDNLSDKENEEDNSEKTVADEDDSEETVVDEDDSEESVVVDGYDITASVKGTPLKDAYADYFMIGVGLNGSSIETATVRSDAMKEIIKYHFNSVTYSNLMKPSYFLDQKGSIENYNKGDVRPAVSFDTAIEGLEFCKENNIKMRGHVLVWHNQVPDWFFKKGYQGDGELVDRETMLMRLESYIKQVLTFMQEEYPGVIYAWDVVNEAVEVAAGAYEKESGFR